MSSNWRRPRITSSEDEDIVIASDSDVSDSGNIDLKETIGNIVIAESSDDEDEDEDEDNLTRQSIRIEKSFLQEDLDRSYSLANKSCTEKQPDSPAYVLKRVQIFKPLISSSDEEDAEETSSIGKMSKGRNDNRGLMAKNRPLIINSSSSSDDEVYEDTQSHGNAPVASRNSELIIISDEEDFASQAEVAKNSSSSIQARFPQNDESSEDNNKDDKTTGNNSMGFILNNTTALVKDNSVASSTVRRPDDSFIPKDKSSVDGNNAMVSSHDTTSPEIGNPAANSTLLQPDNKPNHANNITGEDTPFGDKNMEPKVVKSLENGSRDKTAVFVKGNTNIPVTNTFRPPDYNANQAKNDHELMAVLTKLDNKKRELLQARQAMGTVNLANLPDGGARLRHRVQFIESEVVNLQKQADKHRVAAPAVFPQQPKWKEIRSTADIQHGYGEKAMASHLAEKQEALMRFTALHKSLESCPKEDDFGANARMLRSKTELMVHQRRALQWMSWREKQFPAGGLLADDMGLGKTLTVLALILRSLEEKEDSSPEEHDGFQRCPKKDKKKNKLDGGTLVVCPASLMSQWEREVKLHVKRDTLAVEVHHGTKREGRGYRLARYDLVMTTYSIVLNELPEGALHQVHWARVVLDEGHVIRNYKAKTSEAVCQLQSKTRWVLTGTPLHNKTTDIYALMKFLRCTPFDELGVWKRWIESKNCDQGQQRLGVILTALMLRRTKTQLMAKKELNCLPEKHFHEVEVKLTDAEMAVYGKVLEHSRTLFAQFLHQRAEKEHMMSGKGEYEMLDFHNKENRTNVFKSHPTMNKMVDRYQNLGQSEVKSHVILVLLLRLRQICCHPGLIEAMLNPEEAETNAVEGAEVDALQLINQIKGLSINEKSSGNDEEDVLVISNPVFNFSNVSSKIRAVINTLDDVISTTDDKVVIVSQWSSMLNIIGDHLNKKHIKWQSLTGNVHVNKRGDIINSFNDPSSSRKVLLLSLTAGGVGLNLVGGNHLFLCDLHWNPQLEAQACDRVYRVGQKKSVHIYKFVCDGTIETRIKALQEKKLALATDILTGSHNAGANKLTVQDLKSLFDMV